MLAEELVTHAFRRVPALLCRLWSACEGSSLKLAEGQMHLQMRDTARREVAEGQLHLQMQPERL